MAVSLYASLVCPPCSVCSDTGCMAIEALLLATLQDGKGEADRLAEEHYKYDDGFLDDSELIEYIEAEKRLRS